MKNTEKQKKKEARNLNLKNELKNHIYWKHGKSSKNKRFYLQKIIPNELLETHDSNLVREYLVLRTEYLFGEVDNILVDLYMEIYESISH